MAKKYKLVHLEIEVYDLIEKVQEDYLSHHPEQRRVFLTKSKIIGEALDFYLK